MKLLKLIKQAYNSSSPSLNAHILRSYSSLRWYMSGLGFLLPLLLVIGGIKGLWWLDSPLEMQNSLSAYYHAGAGCAAGDGVYRDLFVGILAAISFCLIIYTGFRGRENWLLNFAGIFLAGVAFFPMGWPEPLNSTVCEAAGFKPFEPSMFLGFPLPVHFASAIAFFIAIMLVNIFTAMDTLDALQKVNKKAFEKANSALAIAQSNSDLTETETQIEIEAINRELEKINEATKKEKKWRTIFSYARFLMPAFLLLTWVVWRLFLRDDHLVLWLEGAGIWAFSLYWLLKSVEILSTQVDLDAINGRVDWNGSNKKKFK